MPASRAALGLRSRVVATTLAALLVLAAACATGPKTTPLAPGAGARPSVLTVPQLDEMVQQGTPLGVILGKIDASGTVYRLTPQQRADLRASGMPATILSYIEQTYQHAIQKNPDLEKSDAQWTQVDGYTYGGLPYGWPREWVVGAPRPGELLR